MYQYLRINLGPDGSSIGSIDLDLLLERVKHCWLKPQHKIKVIQKNVLPKAACVADLGDASDDSMQELDPKIRKCVRRILGLKKSVPDTYIHSRANDGGWESGGP